MLLIYIPCLLFTLFNVVHLHQIPSNFYIRNMDKFHLHLQLHFRSLHIQNYGQLHLHQLIFHNHSFRNIHQDGMSFFCSLDILYNLRSPHFDILLRYFYSYFCYYCCFYLYLYSFDYSHLTQYFDYYLICLYQIYLYYLLTLFLCCICRFPLSHLKYHIHIQLFF